MSSKQDLRGRIAKVSMDITLREEEIKKLINIKNGLIQELEEGVWCAGCGCDISGFSDYYQNEGYCDDCL